MTTVSLITVSVLENGNYQSKLFVLFSFFDGHRLHQLASLFFGNLKKTNKILRCQNRIKVHFKTWWLFYRECQGLHYTLIIFESRKGTYEGSLSCFLRQLGQWQKLILD